MTNLTSISNAECGTDYYDFMRIGYPLHSPYDYGGSSLPEEWLIDNTVDTKYFSTNTLESLYTIK